jgi:hypothetical protein
MEVAHPLVPIEELTRSLSLKSMLPKALSDALGIGLSEVLARYYSISDLDERGRIIGEAIHRRRSEEEGEEWLVGEAHRRSAICEQVQVEMMTRSRVLYKMKGICLVCSVSVSKVAVTE